MTDDKHEGDTEPPLMSPEREKWLREALEAQTRETLIEFVTWMARRDDWLAGRSSK